jgi:hypothetical protein
VGYVKRHRSIAPEKSCGRDAIIIEIPGLFDKVASETRIEISLQYLFETSHYRPRHSPDGRIERFQCSQKPLQGAHVKFSV